MIMDTKNNQALAPASEEFPLLPEADNEQSEPEKLKKVCFAQHLHSREPRLHSSCSELEQDGIKDEAVRTQKAHRCKITGSDLCKASAVVYVGLCIVVSAVYVAVYGQTQQQYFESSDVWIPGKPTSDDPTPPPAPSPVQFYDSPYTEWISQRWTYNDQNFSDWPSLPGDVDEIQQIVHGNVMNKGGVWFLTQSKLLFVSGLGSDPKEVTFLDVGGGLGLEIEENSSIAVDILHGVYITTPFEVVLLNCSGSMNCVVAANSTIPLDLGAVQSTAISFSDRRLWIAAENGLYVASRREADIEVRNCSEIIGPVQSLAWRALVSDQENKKRKPFILKPLSRNSHSPKSHIPYAPGDPSSLSKWFTGKFLSEEDEFGLLVVGTKNRLYFFDGSKWWFEWVSVWYSGQGGVVDGEPTSMSFTPSGELFVSNNVSISRLNTNYTFDRIGPLQGLPYNQVKAVFHSPYTVKHPPAMKKTDASAREGTLWVGTGKGYALFDTASSKFIGYYYGRRWHPGEAVLGFASSEKANVVVVLTDGGIAVVSPEEWTLKRKAAHYQAMLARHTRPPGLVSDCPLEDYVPASCSPSTTDNDGLWTSWLVASEAFRYQVTHDPQAKANSWALFQGMEFLVNVTGVQGLPARSVVTENVTVGGDWHQSTAEPGWKWKGDTSADEIVGHMFAYPIVYHLVAEEEDRKRAVSGLLEEVVDYIMNNSYYLIDVTHRPTRWGVWNPAPINLNQSWSDEHGLNSLQILSYLLSAYHVTKKSEYLEAWKELVDGWYEDMEPHYGLNMINQKITFPRDDNFSDDELALLPYFVYFHALRELRKQQTVKGVEPLAGDLGTLSLQRTWGVVGPERSSAWTAIYGYCMGTKRDQLIEDLVWNLRTWPLELVEWRTSNSHRLDIRFNPEQDRDFHSHSQSVEVLPANERTQLRWNGNPYQLDSGGSSSEMDPGAWLMPYWLARWTGML